MANVFIFTANNEPAQQRFRITVEKGYDLEQILPFIEDGTHRNTLRQVYTDSTCYLWGEAENSGEARSEWERMSEGDLIFGYRENAIMSVSHVLSKMDDPELADRIWGEYGGNPFRLIIFMTRPNLCNITIVPQMFKYLDPTYEGLTKLGSDKLETILAHYVSLDDFTRLVFGQDFPSSFRHSL
ncbi:MAG: hypothetical protein JXC33_13455 [Deltaproteobacteria bacterium]|nr:hypothetical protein [Deltaproteobacteria bacterium]